MVSSEQAAQAERGDWPEADRINSLTLGERECLRLVASGMVSKEIARSLDVSPHTVDARLRTASRKIGACNRFAAAQMLADHLARAESAPSGLDVIPNIGSTGPCNAGDAIAGRAAEPAAFGSNFPIGHSQPTAAPKSPSRKLTIGQRLVLVSAVGLGTFFAFGAVLFILLRLSRWLSPI